MANANDLAHAPTLQLSILAAGEKGTFFPFRCMVHRILMHDGSLPFRPVARSLSCFLTVSLSLSPHRFFSSLVLSNCRGPQSPTRRKRIAIAIAIDISPYILTACPTYARHLMSFFLRACRTKAETPRMVGLACWHAGIMLACMAISRLMSMPMRTTREKPAQSVHVQRVHL